jgi:hypothetical protein
MSGSIPQKLRVGPMVLADSNMQRKVVDLYAASANSQTQYQANDKLLFSLPSYKKSFIDFSKSYMKFTATINNSSTATQGKFACYDNIPIFDRSGEVTLEDIQEYQHFERIQMLLKSKNELENESKNGN